MRNLLVEICYNGAKYHGYQVQSNALTITEVVQDAIEVLVKKREDIIGCSRTDTGVHANSYFFNMRTGCTVPLERFVIAMNHVLPDDIVVLSCKEVPLDFHARYDCLGKEYIYKIWNNPVKNPYLLGLVLNYSEPIDEKRLHEVAQLFVGKHDFSSFCSKGFKKGISMIKTVEYISVYREDDFVYLKIKADGFLYHMVRIIVGTLLYINNGRLSAEDIPNIFKAKDRTRAGKTAPPQGLYLNKIFY